MRNLEESASCCRGRLAPAFVQSSCVQAPEMVLQTAVTPGRARRLLFKIPYGSLRRRSGERVSQLFCINSMYTRNFNLPSACVTLQHSAHCHNNPFYWHLFNYKLARQRKVILARRSGVQNRRLIVNARLANFLVMHNLLKVFVVEVCFF